MPTGSGLRSDDAAVARAEVDQSPAVLDRWHSVDDVLFTVCGLLREAGRGQ